MPFLLMVLLTLLTLQYSYPVYSIELKPHKATYISELKKGVSIKGEAVRELRQLENGQWLYRFDVDSFVADIEEEVTFNWLNGQIQPLHYHYKLNPFLGKKRKRNFNFDWKNKTIKSTIKKGKWTINDIPLNTFDRLSYQLQLLIDVHANTKDMYYQLVRKGKLNESHFQVIGEEKTQTKFGLLDSILVTKVRDKKKKRKTKMWFSKSYPMLLLKMMQIEKKGEKYELFLKSAVIDGKQIKFSPP